MSAAYFASALACGLDVVGEPAGSSADGAAETGRPEASLPPSEADSGPRDSGADAADVVRTCPTGLSGSSMVPAPDASFCIDAYEVSSADYAAFVTAMALPDAGEIDFTERPWCNADGGFAPANSASTPSQPVMYVSYCDAYAYCAWAGKHLCTGQAATGEWPRACSNELTRNWPYGNVADASACNINKNTAPFAHAEGGAYPGCVGGFDGLYDMIGNVAEWVDDCAPDGGTCAILGGAWNSSLAVDCEARAQESPRYKTTSFYGVGFRCCAATTP